MANRIIPPQGNLQTKNSTDSQSYCELCGDSGWMVTIKDGYEIASPCKCYKERIRNNKIRFANIPEAYKDIRLDSFNRGYYSDKEAINEVIATVKYYLNNLQEMIDEGIGLYFYSDMKGSGKTRMATSIANELIYEHNMNVRFVTGLDIISEIRATWDRDSEMKSEGQLMRYLTSVDVLVIDDFGIEKRTEEMNWIDDKFYQIINSRYTAKQITIYTSNYSIGQLKYNQRISNRIMERIYQVHFPEESVREGIAAARQRKLKQAIKEG